MRKWLVALVGLTLALAATTAVSFALVGDGSAGPEQDQAGQVDEPSGDQPPVRSDEDIDPNECNLVHNINACDDEVDEPSGDQPPVRSDEDMDPNECNLVHNINACDDEVDEPSGEARDQYEVTVRFNTSVTQEDMEEAEALLRAFDDDLEFFIQESFPPTGRAFVETDASDFCSTVEAELEAKSYVDGVSCQPWEESDDAEPDAPVEHRNDMPD